MLTPRFSISQNDEFLIIEIEAPFAHVKDTEVFMEGNLFTFHSAPYYLRLHFSGCIIENDKASANFDADKKGFVINAPKVNIGEKFENLDMLTALLVPKGLHNVSKNIEEVCDSASDDDEELEIDWFFTQEMPTEDVVCNGARYGFANQHIGVFTRLQAELSEVIDVQDPDSKSSIQRSMERESREQADFDDDHYLADTFEDGETLCHLYHAGSAEVMGSDELTKEEKDLMISLKPRQFKMKSDDLKEAGLMLIDIMFAYCYDRRTTCGEGNTETGWCISKLSSTLAWLERHTSLKKTIITCMRRALCYPLYRNWKLLCLVLDDIRWLFSAGRKQLVKALLQVHQSLIDSEPRYILNQLYIDDMCIWIQQVDESVITSLREALQSLTVEKGDVGLDLVELEAAANIVLAEEKSSREDVAESMRYLALDSDDSDSATSSDSSDSSTDSDDDASSDEDDKPETAVDC